MTTEQALISAADIARLAGVGRAAVSNWRRRHDDFPQPAGGTAHSPLFALPEVEAWLAGQGRRVRLSAEERLWQLIRTSTDDLRLGVVVGRLGRFAYAGPAGAAQEAEAESGAGAEARAEAESEAGAGAGAGAEAGADRTAQELGKAARELRERGGPETYEYLVRRFVEAHIRRVLTTPVETAQLMARLLDVKGKRVYDPACGIGTLLIAAEEGGARRLIGQDRESYAADITWTRLEIRRAAHAADGDSRIDAQVATGDSLTADGFTGERVDVGLCDPPFGDRAWGYDELTADPRWVHGLPPRGEPELAWVQHVLWHLVPGGEAAVLMPPAAADRRSGRRIRSQLLRTGTLRAVIALPPGSAAGSTATPHLWLLRRASADDRLPSHVLMMDAAALDGPESTDLVIGRWERFVRGPGDEEPSEFSRMVPLIELLDDAVDLAPARHLRKATTVATDFDAARERFRHWLDEVSAATAELRGLTDEAGGQTMTTLGELIQNGTVSVLQAPLKMGLRAGPIPVLTAKDISLGRPPSGRTGDTGTLLMLQPGDVVMPLPARRSEVRVIGADVRRVAAGAQVQVLRANPGRCDPYFLACFLDAARAARASATSLRSELRRVMLPRLPLEEQRPYGEVYRRFLRLSSALRDLTGAGEEMITLGYDGLAGGGLRPED